MGEPAETLEALAEKRKIQLYDSFAQFLAATETLYRYERSLLDCYRFSGHACHAITGAFLSTEEAIKQLFPEDHICRRGELIVEMGSELEERAAGPRSQVIGFLAGAWGDIGFPGLRGQFVRKDLLSFGHKDIAPSMIRFKRPSTQKEVIVEYNPRGVMESLNHGLDFPQSWRAELLAVLKAPEKTIHIINEN